MSAHPLAVVIDCSDPEVLARFWSAALDAEMSERNADEYAVHDPTATWTPLYFMKVPEPSVGKNRHHLDLLTEGSLEDEVTRLQGLGARPVEIRQDPATLENPDTWAVLEDPEGHVFCVTTTANLTGWV